MPWQAHSIGGVCEYASGLALFLAGVMIVIGGFQYLTAGGDASRVKAGKDRITDAVIGMLLLIGSYVILNTINPDLISLKGLQVIKQGPKPPVLEASAEAAAKLGK